MDNGKMSQFISELRKSNKMTQKELAAQLGVTDKAVSKWERGLSCPDISLLPVLCDILGITINELLNGKRLELSSSEVESIIETTIQYADTATKSKSKDVRVIYAIITSAILLLGIIVCTICNFAINGKLTWALFPITSIIFVWSIIEPTVIWSKKGIHISLILLSLLIIPFLFALERIIGIAGLILPIGIRVSAIALIYFWEIYLLFCKSNLPGYIAAAFAVISGLPISLWINSVVSKFTEQSVTDIWDILIYSILIIISMGVFIFGYVKHRRLAK